MPLKTGHFLPFCASLLSLVAGFFVNLHAQMDIPTQMCDVTEYGVSDGLPSGMIRHLQQDENGYLWLATKEGLSRFDGVHFKNYIHQTDDSLSLPDDHVVFLFTDSRGWRWVCTNSNGIALFDPDEEQFFQTKVVGPSVVREDASGNILAGGFGSKWRYLEIDPAWKHPKEAAAHFSQSPPPLLTDWYDGLPDIPGKLFLSQQYGITWLADDTVFSYTLNPADRTAHLDYTVEVDHLRFPNTGSYLTMTQDTVLGWSFVIGTRLSIVLDARTGEVIDTLNVPPLDRFFYTCDVTRQGELLSVLSQNGLLKIKLPSLETSVIRGTQENIFLNSKGMNSTYPPFMDREGLLWLPTTGYGLFKFDASDPIFHYHGKDHVYPSVYRFRPIDDRLIAHEGKGVTIFDPVRQESKEISTELLQGKARILSRKVYDAGSFQVEMVDVYIDDSTSLLCRFDRDENLDEILTRPPYSATLPPSRSGFYLEDGSFCYINTHYTKNSGFEGAPLEVRIWPPGQLDQPQVYGFTKPRNEMALHRVESVWLDSKQRLWMAMQEGGIVIFDMVAKTWEHIVHDPADPHSLATNRLTALQPDPDQPDRYFWVASAKGLHRLDLTTMQFKVYNEAHGFPNPVVYGIQQDHLKNLWVGTNNGLCIFDPKAEKVIRVFTRADGLQNNEFNRGASTCFSDGTLFFGGIGGINWFDSRDAYQPSRPSPTLITGLRLFNEPLEYLRKDKSAGTFSLPAPLGQLEELVLDHDQNMLGFEFTLMQMRGSKSHTFRYRLAGLQDDWINGEQEHLATFTNIPPGSYTFEVQGANGEGIWSEEPARIRIVIRPPWWQTWWFRTLVICAILGIGGTVIWYRIQRAREVQALRNQISRDLHDDIGSTLSSVALFAAVGQTSVAESDDKTSLMLSRIVDNTTLMMESMNDIIWAVRSDNDHMEAVVNRMRAFMSEIEDSDNWTFDLQAPDEVLRVKLNMVQRRNLYMIFKEAINNALKYAKGTQLTVSIRPTGKYIEMVISDDGLGFDPEADRDPAASTGGNGLGNMRTRAGELRGELEIQSAPGQGTRVMLRFPA